MEEAQLSRQLLRWRWRWLVRSEDNKERWRGEFDAADEGFTTRETVEQKR